MGTQGIQDSILSLNTPLPQPPGCIDGLSFSWEYKHKVSQPNAHKHWKNLFHSCQRFYREPYVQHSMTYRNIIYTLEELLLNRITGILLFESLYVVPFIILFSYKNFLLEKNMKKLHLKEDFLGNL